MLCNPDNAWGRITSVIPNAANYCDYEKFNSPHLYPLWSRFLAIQYRTSFNSIQSHHQYLYHQKFMTSCDGLCSASKPVSFTHTIKGIVKEARRWINIILWKCYTGLYVFMDKIWYVAFQLCSFPQLYLSELWSFTMVCYIAENFLYVVLIICDVGL